MSQSGKNRPDKNKNCDSVYNKRNLIEPKNESVETNKNHKNKRAIDKNIVNVKNWYVIQNNISYWLTGFCIGVYRRKISKGYA